MLISRNKTTIDRFLEKIEIDPVNGCWLWTAGKLQGGYGRFKAGKKKVLAHRWAHA